MPLSAARARVQASPMDGGKAMTGTMENGDERRGGAWRIVVWGGAAALLLTPLAAMRFTREVAWTGFDFAVFGAMLALACGAFELAARARGDWTWRAAAAVAIGAAFLLVWATLAVGFVGDPNNPANLMFAGVLAVAVTGGLIARWRPAGMARALVATAIAQALAGGVGVVSGLDPRPITLLAPTAVFVALWLVSAALFRRAARTPAAAP